MFLAQLISLGGDWFLSVALFGLVFELTGSPALVAALIATMSVPFAALTFVGGPLAFVETGDAIEIDVPARRIHLHVGEEELNRRRAAWKQPPPKYPRGYGAMFSEHIRQADEGCDFDFLVPGRSGPP